MLWAASMGHTDCLRLLVDAGADVNAKDNVCDYNHIFNIFFSNFLTKNNIERKNNFGSYEEVSSIKL